MAGRQIDARICACLNESINMFLRMCNLSSTAALLRAPSPGDGQDGDTRIRWGNRTSEALGAQLHHEAQGAGPESMSPGLGDD